MAAPVIVRPSVFATLAMPKSVTTGWPSMSTMILAGLISRWMTPCRWAYPRASATRLRIWVTISGGSGACPLMIASSGCPSMNFMTKSRRSCSCLTA